MELASNLVGQSRKLAYHWLFWSVPVLKLLPLSITSNGLVWRLQIGDIVFDAIFELGVSWWVWRTDLSVCYHDHCVIQLFHCLVPLWGVSTRPVDRHPDFRANFKASSGVIQNLFKDRFLTSKVIQSVKFWLYSCNCLLQKRQITYFCTLKT